ncbi:MAG: FadR/GntR family transcriptional regulator [Paralcaligenes sp.]
MHSTLPPLGIMPPSQQLADKLYENLLGWIVQGKFDDTGKLPSEADLAKKFGVSRPVVREALSRLRADGIVMSKRGSGSYIRRRPQKEFFEFAPLGGVADVMRCFEYRIALEGEAAGLAAARRTDKDLAEINNALDELAEASEKGLLGADADIRFHNAVATATRNYLFESTMAALADYTKAGISIARTLSLRSDATRLHLVQQEHAVIYRAIEERDVESARSAMRVHISNARTRLLSGCTEP